jgi:hypothetical protein
MSPNHLLKPIHVCPAKEVGRVGICWFVTTNGIPVTKPRRIWREKEDRELPARHCPNPGQLKMDSLRGEGGLQEVRNAGLVSSFAGNFLQTINPKKGAMHTCKCTTHTHRHTGPHTHVRTQVYPLRAHMFAHANTRKVGVHAILSSSNPAFSNSRASPQSLAIVEFHIQNFLKFSVVTQFYNPSTQEAEAGGSLRPAWAT